MKIAIISDSHDNSTNISKFLDIIKKKKIQAIIHCGDVTRRESFDLIKNNFKGRIYLSLGNGDFRKDYLDIKNVWQDSGSAIIDSVRIGFSHYKKLFSPKFDFFFYGHSHKPWLEEVDTCILANPGNLADMRYPATFAILDTKTRNLKLEILNKKAT